MDTFCGRTCVKQSRNPVSLERTSKRSCQKNPSLFGINTQNQNPFFIFITKSGFIVFGSDVLSLI